MKELSHEKEQLSEEVAAGSETATLRKQHAAAMKELKKRMIIESEKAEHTMQTNLDEIAEINDAKGETQDAVQHMLPIFIDIATMYAKDTATQNLN